LNKLFKIINFFLKKGGNYLLIEHHPITVIPNGDDYFGKIYTYKTKSSYVSDSTTHSEMLETNFGFKISDVINGVIESGMKINFLHEFNICNYKVSSDCEEIEIEKEKWFKMKKSSLFFGIPLMFSLKSEK
jgi:hypothetical protein